MKVKIHPSPPPHGGTAASGSGADIASVLRLLPAAIVALSAVLGTEDKEVLAYLILRSAAEERPRCSKTTASGGGGGGHRAAFDCGCFDCYTGFWYRWDRSPNRELIHQAIEAFEESLANKERGGARGRRRGRKGKDKDVPAPAPAVVMPAPPLAVPAAVEMESVPAPAPLPATECAGDCEKGIDKGEGDNVTRGYEMEQEEVAVERRGRWPDVMGIIQSRLFSFWGPGI